MTTQELKKYMSMVVDMESSIYMQEQLLKRMREEDNRLCIRRNIEKPNMPSQPQRKSSGCVVSLALLIAGLVLMFSELNETLCILGMVLLLISIGCFIGTSDRRKNNKTVEQSYQKNMEQYHQNLALYNKQVAEQESRITRETPKKLALQAQLRQIEREIVKSRNTLSKLYSYNIIYPKYRKLEFVCSLYEYLCSGRCNFLEGHEGGYNILEQEIRLNRIISQVERVINQLNSIRYSQTQLYNAVTDSNRKLDQIMNSTERMASQISYLGNQASAINSRLNDLQKSSELTAYYTERNSKHLEYMNWMNYHSGAYRGAGYYNSPPSY